MGLDKHIKCRISEDLQKEASKLFNGSMSEKFRQFIKDNVKASSDGQKLTHTCFDCKNEFDDKYLKGMIWLTHPDDFEDMKKAGIQDAFLIYCPKCQKVMEDMEMPPKKPYQGTPTLKALMWQLAKKDNTVFQLPKYVDVIIALHRNFPKQYELEPGALFMPIQSREDLSRDIEIVINMDVDKGFI